MSNKYKRKQENNKNNRGFYISLSVCLLAIVAAAIVSFGDFGSLSNYENDYTEFSSEVPEHQIVDNVMSGVQIDDPKESIDQEDEEIKNKVYNTLTSIEDEAIITEKESTPTDVNEAVEVNTEPSLCIYPSGKNVIKPFSNGNPVYSITLNDWRVHDGVDFSAEKGSIIKSITDGVVKDVYTDQNLGKVIVIEHTGEFEAHYCGLGDTTLVNPGDHVVVGQDIGSVKAVPCEILEQDHLHLAIRKGGTWINPMQILESAEENTEQNNN